MPEGQDRALERARALDTLRQLSEALEQEFESLKVRDLGCFERLQPLKTALLEKLTASHEAGGQDASVFVQDLECRELLLHCRDAHRRNETLLQRHLEAVRGALGALSASSALQGVEVYDRLGQMRGRASRRGIAEA